MRRRCLPLFPNYQHARAVEAVDLGISEADFMQRFVLQHRPCVVRGGARHWPAIQKWNVEALRTALGAVPVGHNYGFRFEPISQYSLEDVFQGIVAPLNAPVPMTASDFLDHVISDESSYVQLNSEPLAVFKPLLGDLGTFDFLDIGRHPPRFYPDRLFLSRSGYTDWHAHVGDETLTVQVCSPKEFLLLPPDQATFDAMRPISRRGVWRVPSIYWPASFAALVPWRVVLEPSDVVYIPMHWWHAAESVDDGLNVTIAKVFRTPLRWLSDLRIPNARFSVAINLVMAALRSALSRDVNPVAKAMRMTLLTLGGFPLALARNGALVWGNGRIGGDGEDAGSAGLGVSAAIRPVS